MIGQEEKVVYISVDKNDTRSWEYEDIAAATNHLPHYVNFHPPFSSERADSVIQIHKLLGQLHHNLEELTETNTDRTSTILQRIIVIYKDIVKISKIGEI